MVQEGKQTTQMRRKEAHLLQWTSRIKFQSKLLFNHKLMKAVAYLEILSCKLLNIAVKAFLSMNMLGLCEKKQRQVGSQLR